MGLILHLIFCLISFAFASKSYKEGGLETYRPVWEDLDKRPLPEWYDRAKIGIFIHWGVFSVPSFGSEWFWYNWHRNDIKHLAFMKKNYRPGFTYQEFAPMFTAEFFQPEDWADLFVKAGARYVVLTSKHHEGYTLFPSKRSFSWNSVEVGPKRDLVGDLSEAIRAKGLKFGVYHSLFEWFNPIYLEDKNNLFQTRRYTETILWPDLKQLVRKYKPSVIWSDGDWECFDTYWNSTGLIAWLYNDSPVKNEVVVNDRWGIGCYGKHGDFYNYADKYNPGKLEKHKWENAFTIDSKSWGYRRNTKLEEILTIKEILNQTISTVSCGGNVLINIGPTKEGTISPIYQERLLQLGKWLQINGEAIYDSSPWTHQKDSLNKQTWYTCQKSKFNSKNPIAPPTKDDQVLAVYAMFLEWPKNNILALNDAMSLLHSGSHPNVVLLGSSGQNLSWEIKEGTAYFTLPDKGSAILDNAWTLKFTPAH